MARVVIEFVGDNDASPVIKTITGDIDDLGKEAESADKKSKGLFSSLGGLGKVVAGAGIGLAITAVAGLGAALVGGIGDAREAARVNAQTEQTIQTMGNAAGVSAQHVQDFAASLSAANGASLFGDSQYQEATNLLLTFDQIKGTTLDLATTLTGDLAQALGGAPADQALMLGKALNNPTEGMGALRRVGLAFTADQEAQIKALQASGDMMGAQSIIIAELNKQVGGSAAAAAAADGGMAMFRDRMGELAESVGAQVLPALNTLLAWLNSPEVMAGINAIVTGLVDGLGATFTWIATVGLPALQIAFEAVWPAIQVAVTTVYAFLKDVVWPWLQGTAFPWLANVALPALQSAFETVWPIIQAAVSTVYTFLKDTVWPWLQGTAFPWLADVALPALKVAFEVAWKAISVAVSAVYTFFHDTVWPWLQEALRHTTEEEIPAIRKAFETAWPIIQSAVSTVYAFLHDTVWPWLSENIPKVATWIEGVQTRWSTAWGLISGAVETAKNAISGVIATIKSTIQGAIDLINTLIGRINAIPGVNIPTIPGISTGGGSGGSGFGTKSVGTFTPLGGIAGHPGGSVTSTTIHIDARGSSDPRGVGDNVGRALTAAGIRADIRLRTT